MEYFFCFHRYGKKWFAEYILRQEFLLTEYNIKYVYRIYSHFFLYEFNVTLILSKSRIIRQKSDAIGVIYINIFDWQIGNHTPKIDLKGQNLIGEINIKIIREESQQCTKHMSDQCLLLKKIFLEIMIFIGNHFHVMRVLQSLKIGSRWVL